MSEFSEYIVYVDESGDHGLESMDPDYPVFVLAFCVFRKTEYADQATSLLQHFKFKYFGHDMVVLHEHEIRKSEGPFRILFDAEVRQGFMNDLNQLMVDVPFALFAAFIRKDQFRDEHGSDQNLYHVAVRSCLIRVHRFLTQNGAAEALTHVVFEQRGRREDDELELEFRRVCDGENSDRKNLPFSIVFASKQINSCGLQIADLVARPIGRKFLKPDQANRAYDILKEKFFRDEKGRIEGFGLETFP